MLVYKLPEGGKVGLTDKQARWLKGITETLLCSELQLSGEDIMDAAVKIAFLPMTGYVPEFKRVYRAFKKRNITKAVYYICHSYVRFDKNLSMRKYEGLWN